MSFGGGGTGPPVATSGTASRRERDVTKMWRGTAWTCSTISSRTRASPVWASP